MKTTPSPKTTLRKTTRHILTGSIAAAFAAALLGTPAAQAATYYWDVDGTTAGFSTVVGAWDTGAFWNTDATGGAGGTVTATTTSIDDLIIGPATTNTGTITLTGTKTAKSLTFGTGVGAVTLSGGVLSLGAGGGITVDPTAGDQIISSGLTIAGNNTFNVGAGRLLTLNTGTFTRGTRAALNLQGLGNGSSTMTGLTNAAMVNNIVGPWASVGTAAATTYVKLGLSGNVDGLGYTGGADGVVAAASTNVVSTASPGTVNYTLGAAGTLGASASINTLRYSGAAGTLATATAFTTKGIMNAGSGLLTFTGAVTAGAAGTEIVINTANADITMSGASALFTGTINKTGPGTFTLPSGAAHSVGAWTVNQGVLSMSTSAGDALPSGTINSGGTMKFGSGNKFNNGAVITVNAGGTFDLNGQQDTIGAVSGSGSVIGATGSQLFLSNAGTFSGAISGDLLLRTTASTSNITLSGNNTYTGATTGIAGVLLATKPAALSGYTVAGKVIFNGGTIGAQVGGSGWTTGEVDTLLTNATKTSGALGIDTTNGNLTQWTSFTTTNFGPALGLTKLGTNTLTLDQANTYTGNTRVIAGKIVLGNALALQNSTYDTASVAGGLDLTGFTTPTLGGLTGSVNLSEVLITGYSSISNLTLNTQAGITQVYSGDVGNGNGSMILTLSGAGTQALSGTNTYTGGTSVTGGVLVFRNTNAKATTGTHAFGATATLGLGVGAAPPLFSSTDIDNAFSGTMTGNLSNVTVTPTTNVGIDTTAASFTYTTSVPGSPTRGLVKLGANTLTLTGTNTYTGTTTISAGTLQLGDGTTGNDGTIASSPGIVNNVALIYNRFGTISYGGGISGTGTVTKLGAGTQTLSGLSATAANNYSGTTTIDQGTLAITTTNPSLTGSLTFGASAGTTNNGTLDLSAASATFAGALLVQTNSATANNISIGASRTLLVTGAVTMGFSTTANSTSNLTATGLGTLSIGTSGVATNANITTGAGATDAIANSANLNMSGLSTFYANLGTGTFRVGAATANNPASSSTVILAGDSTIQATNLNLASRDGNGAFQTLRLGSGTNVLNVGTINVAGVPEVNGDGRSNGTLNFNGATGTLTVRGLAGGSSRADLNVGYGSMNTASSPTGIFDVTGHTADLRLGNMTIGARTLSAGGGNPNGTFSFDTGTLDVENLTVGRINNAGTATGTVNLAGGTATFNNTGGPIQLGVRSAGTTGSGTLNISGTAVVSVAANGGNSIRLGDATVSGGTATGLVDLTGGTLTVAGDIIRGATTGTSNATIRIRGGTLNLGGNDIGTLASAVTLTAESGELKNVLSINGTGGLTKTTAGTLILSGTNTYTGATDVNSGTLNLNGTLGTGSNVLNANATTSIGVSQTLAALNIGAGAVVTLTATPPFAPLAGEAFSGPTSAVVPEPGSIGLLLVGSLGLLARRRRQA